MSLWKRVSACDMSISPVRPSFRNGFYFGLLSAVGLGIYLLQLWESTNQVRLHNMHLLKALEQKSWSEVQEFIDPSYLDQWGHDRARVMVLLRQVLPFARNLRIETRETVVRATGRKGRWRARVRVDADSNEVSSLIKERINALEEPFELEWRQRSGKPWDWKLVQVSNPSL